MSTNGIWGFKKGRKLKLQYIHWDSYPSVLGKAIVTYIKTHILEDDFCRFEDDPHSHRASFIEWRYLINLDTQSLFVLYHCEIIDETPLSEIRTMHTEGYIKYLNYISGGK